ncbi:MAG: PAS domain S-box protein [bacterium]
MSELNNNELSQIEELEERVKQLGLNKAYLELIIQLMSKMGEAQGLENTIDALLNNILNVIGGDNLILYYKIDDAIYYSDVYGKKTKITQIEDADVQKVYVSHKPIEFEHDFIDTKLITREFTKAYTWIYPLMVGREIIGVFKMESLHINLHEFYQQLPVFFNYVALTLKNAIVEYTRLKEINAELEREIEIRKQTEEELKIINEELENRVEERTAELHSANLLLERELVERVRAEEQIASQFTLLSALINSSGDMIIFSLDKNYCYTAFNEKHRIEMKQIWNADIKIGTSLLDCMTIPELKELAKKSINRALNGEAFSEIQHQLDADIYYEFFWNPIFQHNEIIGVTAFIQDITYRKRAENQIQKLNRIYAVLSNINQSIVRIHDTKVLFDEVCRITVEYGKFRMVWIGLLNSATNKVEVAASNGFTGDYLKKINIDLNDELLSSGPTGQAIKSGKCKISNNIETDKSMLPWLEDAIKYGYKSSASFPIIVFNKVVGALSIYSDEINFFEKEDINLLIEMALDISFALEFMKTENRRKDAELALREKSEELERYFTHSLDLLCIADTDGYFRRLNPEWESTLGYSLKELEGRRFLDFVHPDDLESTLQAIARLEDQKEVLRFTNRYLCKDSSYKWIEWNSFPSGKLIYAAAHDITERKLIEQERQTNLRYFESVDRINRAVQGTNNLEKMMSSVLDTVLSIFNCDRAFLLYPCDPNTDTWKVPMERTKPEYPGVLELGLEIPLDLQVAQTFQTLLSSDGVVQFGPNTSYPLPAGVSEQFGFKCLMSMAIYPKIGKAWQFGIHQCSHAHIWNAEEERLFKEIGRRLEDSLTVLIANSNLKESEERFRRIAENARDIIYRMTLPEGKYEYVSPACLSMLGYTPEEFYANPILFQQLIHPDWHNYFREQWANLIKGEMPPFYEYQIIHKSGEVRWLNQRNILVCSDSGSPVAIEAIVTDITESKCTEEALRENEQRLKDAEHLAHLGNWEYDIVNNYLLGSDEIYRIFELDPEKFDATFEAFLDTVHPEDREAVKFAYTNSLKTKSHYSIDHRILFADGRIKYVHDQCETFYEGDIPIRSIGTVQDITERKQAEEALRKSETLLNTTQQLTKVGGWEFDVKSGKSFWTEELYRIHEIPNDPNIDHIKESLSCYRPEDSKIISDAFKRACENGESYDLEFPFTTFTGKQIWIRTTAQPVYEEGKVVRLVGNILDITERKQAEISLRESEWRYREIFDNVMDGLYLLEVTNDDKFRTMEVNPALEKLTGVPRSFSVGKTQEETVPPEVAEIVNAKYRRCLKAGHPIEEELELELPTGRRYFHSFLIPSRDETGKIHRIVGISRDITERKRAEDALRESEERYRLLHESAGVGIGYYTTDGIVISYNNLAASHMNGKPEDFNGKSIYEIFTKSEADFYLNRIKLSAASESNIIYEDLINLPSGDKWFLSIFSRICDSQKNVIGIQIISQDITERKVAEQELKEQMDEINRFNRLMVGREEKMIELKKEINALLEKEGKPKKYSSI